MREMGTTAATATAATATTSDIVTTYMAIRPCSILSACDRTDTVAAERPFAGPRLLPTRLQSITSDALREMELRRTGTGTGTGIGPPGAEG